jgi:uncharacterized damage-inducible protein DinB
VFPDWELSAAREASVAVLADYDAFLEAAGDAPGSADKADFGRMVVYRNTAGTEFRTSVADILTHVFLHGSYHRGQINARLRGAGFDPTVVDYIAYTRLN